MIKKIFLIAAYLLLSITPTITLAYTETTDGGEMIATVSPKNPGSFSEVNISIKSFGADLDRADITWTIDGKVVKNGRGIKNLSFKTGPVGKRITVDILSAGPEAIIAKTISIIPAYVDIVWESDSYVPNFYKGAALPSRGSKIKLHAIPNFKNEEGIRLKPSDLIYKWRVNYQNVENSTGNLGSLELTLQDITQNKITVEAEDSSGQIAATKTLTISPATPKNIFYEVDSLLGPIYNKAVSGAFDMQNKETVIKAEPYFISLNADRSDFSYLWTINELPFIPEGGDIGTITLRQGTGKGESSLGVTIKNSLGQLVTGSALIKFGQNIFNF